MDDFWRVNLVGASAPMERVRRQIQRLARIDATVLIEGETGTGKELAARAIHYLGARRDRAFVPVNCGAISDSLVESELFGHERGAFTDAKTPSPGLVGQAAGGTLFLDEVEVLTPKAQAALLRFLQDRTYRRVGGTALFQADVRIVAASNVDLLELVRARHFRSDLLYRLKLLALRMPPLRERPGDALELARLFVRQLALRYRVPEKPLHPVAVDYLARHDWPGNVRELENLVHREFLMSEDAELRLDAARPDGAADLDAAAIAGDAGFKLAKARVVIEFERRYVKDLLARTGGNITRAARLARQDRSAFGKLVRKHLDADERS